jgi:hypothetical protein
MVFAVLSAPILLGDLWRLLSGQIDDDHLVLMQESAPHPAMAEPLGIGWVRCRDGRAFSLLLCGAALMWHLNMFDAQILAQNVINGADSFPLLAVPFFMLAGEIMNAGGLSGASSTGAWRWSATCAAAWAT